MSHEDAAPPRAPLKPDPAAAERWAQLPQGRPSRGALPPLMGGSRALWGWMALTLVLILLALVFGRGF